MAPWLLYIAMSSATPRARTTATNRYPWDEAAEIAIRVCKEATGADETATTPLREIVFSLFEEGVYDAWRDAAEHHLGPALEDETETEFDKNE